MQHTPSIRFGGVAFDTILWDNSKVVDSGTSIGVQGDCGGIYFTESPANSAPYSMKDSTVTRVTFSADRIAQNDYDAIIFDGGQIVDRFGRVRWKVNE